MAGWMIVLCYAATGRVCVVRLWRSEETSSTSPFVLGAQHRYRNLRRVGVRRHTVGVEILSRLLDLHVAGERGDNRLVNALGLHLVDHADDQLREHHRRRDDRVPVTENERMDAGILEAELDRVAIGGRRLAASDVDRRSEEHTSELQSLAY